MTAKAPTPVVLTCGTCGIESTAPAARKPFYLLRFTGRYGHALQQDGSYRPWTRKDPDPKLRTVCGRCSASHRLVEQTVERTSYHGIKRTKTVTVPVQNYPGRAFTVVRIPESLVA